MASINSINKRIRAVNLYIQALIDADISAIEPDSTWEDFYYFEPIKEITEGSRYVRVDHPISSHKSKFTRSLISDVQDLNYFFNWIIRGSKKGFRESTGMRLLTIQK